MKKWMILLVVLSLAACKKDETPTTTAPTSSALTMKITYNVDGDPLVFDTIRYVTPSGLPYSVITLHYYLSNVELIKSDSSVVHLSDYYYCDGRDVTTTLDAGTVAVGDYIGLRFSIGLDSAQNVLDGLPATVDNVNMIWPDALGGGYHFLKFEGYFTSGGSNYGYNMHIGKNVNLIPVTLYHAIHVSGSTTSLSLKMNVNEWLKNPAVYDFNTDGNYSMMNDTAMQKLALNGKDVISF